MTPALWGTVLGGIAGLGLVLILSRVQAIRRTQLSLRVLPYVRDLPQVGQHPALRVASSSPTNAAAGVFGPILRTAADVVERVLGGSASVRRRLERSGQAKSVHDFRIEQVLWGLMGFGLAAAYGLLRALSNPGSAIMSLVLCIIAFAVGVIARDSWLSSQASRREREILVEFPTLAELLALAVAAGEGPVAALDRVVRRSGGELSKDLGSVLSDIRLGEPVSGAFDRLSANSGLPLVSRFAQGIAVAVERGTPLSDVLHAQAADVREAGRRELIESAARKEVFMMVPVVFFVLPVTILFAFWPGLVGLSLIVP